MEWYKRKVLITGATGLVGSWLVKRLVEARATVVALVRDTDPQSELLRGGMIRRISVVNGAVEHLECIERAINEHEIDTVFHLAAQTLVGVGQRSPLATFESNIRGSYSLLEACRRHADRIRAVVVASSDKAYGQSSTLPYTEALAVGGRAPYEASKACADILSQCYASTYKLPVVIARCGNIYGGGDLNWSRLIPGTIASLLRGERPVIRSDGTFLRDYVYVEDAVSAYLLMSENAHCPDVAGEAFNFGPNKPATVLEIVETIAGIMGCRNLEPLIINQAQGEIHDQYLDSSKARKRLGWAPTTNLENGLRQTVEWYREFLNSSDKESSRSDAF